MNTIFRVAKKEFAAFFSSPIAYIFIGAFLGINLFIFFWVETFFASNITEVRPLFAWMPILLIFLTSAVTMRLWAEEHRAGTLEFLLTSPVNPLTLILGKFFACLGLVALALLLTLPLPITVSFLGDLDWGPVLGGYVATMFLAAAYIAIGLYISVKSENQIVSLIVTVLVCAFFYLIGSDTLVAFFGNRSTEFLQLLGSGSRFDSITRGVIDLRDLYYYLSITAIFLCLNLYGLERIRWSNNQPNSHHKRWKIATLLVMANFLAANFWLYPMGTLRTDLTQGKIYSISSATRSYLNQLKEPLLIRGYFSAQTHPLLAPLVPRLQDLLEEYGVAASNKVRVEFVDPLENPDLEQEAGQKYGIRPIPFQTASKYQASVTNSYFDILIQYGDQFETLGFRDLIEVKVRNEQDMDVELRNPEYDITRAIKKVLYSYQGGGDLFSNIDRPVTFTGYISPDNRLPKELVSLKSDLQQLLDEMQKTAGDRFQVSMVDPEEGDGKVAEELQNQYGFRPMAASLFDSNTFWFYMVAKSGDQTIEIPLPEDLEKESLNRAIQAGFKRFATGFTKTVALNTPPATPAMAQYGMPARGPQFSMLRELLSQEHVISEADLKNGQVPGDAELLMIIAPDKLDEKQLFAMDQFLMQGGTVVLATSPYSIDIQGGLSATEHTSGLEDWLKFQGITLEKSMVMDPKNSAFPVPVERNVGGFTIQETHMVNYPFFVDIRPEANSNQVDILSGIPQVTMNWASPLQIDAEKNADRIITPLLKSSAKSWLTDDTNLQPDFEQYGEYGFPVGKEQDRYLLAASIEGSFTSYFAGKPSPLLQKDEQDKEQPATPEQDTNKEEKQIISRQLDKSVDSARIILFASNSFIRDIVLNIGASVMRTNNLSPVQLMANTVDWSLEDRALLSIRGRSHFSRPLAPLDKNMQIFWEYLNYGLACAGLFLVWFVARLLKRRSQSRYAQLIAHVDGGTQA
ncbi:Gldg family protein [Desulfogranum japonicum]|uniref:Gldg family protein n=1 Tax=Desulfogranum japonicum TaxID=231447 RepID=UPI0003FCF441|nr:Gldg family protein [Desulfogranum japonicum]